MAAPQAKPHAQAPRASKIHSAGVLVRLQSGAHAMIKSRARAHMQGLKPKRSVSNNLQTKHVISSRSLASRSAEVSSY